MYFRRKSIKGPPLVQLVESYRNGEGQPRQRVVASLGDLQLPEKEKALIAKIVERSLKGSQGDWFEADLSTEATHWVTRILQLAQRSKGGRITLQSESVDGVLLDDIETENVVQLGPLLVALKAWKKLDISSILESRGMNPPAIAAAQLMVANRLIEPLSEWA